MLFIIFTANIPKFNSGCINFRGRNARTQMGFDKSMWNDLHDYEEISAHERLLSRAAA